MRRFHGMATRCLGQYRGWRRLLERYREGLTLQACLLEAWGYQHLTGTKPKKTASHLVRVTDLQASNTQNWYNSTRIRLLADDNPGTIKTLQYALRLDSGNPFHLRQLAKAQSLEGHYEQAIASFN